MMTDFPAPPDAQATLANWRMGPFNKWAFHHVREIVPSANIPHDPAGVQPFEMAPRDLSGLVTETQDGPLDFEALIEAADVDGLVILKDGKLIHETYRNGMGPADPHILMSVSKSMLGLLAGILADKGILNLQAEATAYIPELEATAFRGATVQQLLDMRTGILFEEDYFATSGPIIEYRKAQGWNPLPPGETPSDLRSFFLTLTESKGPHGGPFDYKSPCTDLMGWVIERATGKRYADVFAEEIWTRIGAEQPAYITVDRFGAPRVAGGMCMTTRDLARVGQMMAEGGRGIVPEWWVEDITGNGDPAAWDDGSFAEDFSGRPMHYRAKWYVLREERPVLMCYGIHGQNLFVDRAAGLVMAKHSSMPVPTDPDAERLGLLLFDTLRKAL